MLQCIPPLEEDDAMKHLAPTVAKINRLLVELKKKQAMRKEEKRHRNIELEELWLRRAKAHRRLKLLARVHMDLKTVDICAKILTKDRQQPDGTGIPFQALTLESRLCWNLHLTASLYFQQSLLSAQSSNLIKEAEAVLFLETEKGNTKEMLLLNEICKIDLEVAAIKKDVECAYRLRSEKSESDVSSNTLIPSKSATDLCTQDSIISTLEMNATLEMDLHENFKRVVNKEECDVCSVEEEQRDAVLQRFSPGTEFPKGSLKTNESNLNSTEGACDTNIYQDSPSDSQGTSDTEDSGGTAKKHKSDASTIEETMVSEDSRTALEEDETNFSSISIEDQRKQLDDHEGTVKSNESRARNIKRNTTKRDESDANNGNGSDPGVEKELECMAHIQAQTESLQEVQLAEIDAPIIDTSTNISNKSSIPTKQSSVALVPNHSSIEVNKAIEDSTKDTVDKDERDATSMLIGEDSKSGNFLTRLVKQVVEKCEAEVLSDSKAEDEAILI